MENLVNMLVLVEEPNIVYLLGPYFVELMDEIGSEKTASLMSMFEGVAVKFPCKREVQNAHKKMQIWKDFQRGRTTKALAKKFSLPEADISVIIKGVDNLIGGELWKKNERILKSRKTVAKKRTRRKKRVHLIDGC